VLSEEEEAWGVKKSMMVSPSSRRNRVRCMDMATHIPSRDRGEKLRRKAPQDAVVSAWVGSRGRL
jgi:hypothetical protein